PGSWLGNVGNARRSLSFIQNNPAIPTAATATVQLRMLTNCTLLDDITFATTGQPSLAGGAVDRGGSYSWAWLMRRPKAGNKSVCSITVVVYVQRPLGTGKTLAARELAYSSTFTTGYGQPNLITLKWQAGSAPTPQVREGGWIFDVTPGPLVTVAPNQQQWTPGGNANFHRVVSAGDVGTLVVHGPPAVTYNTMDLELATPI